MPWKVALTNWVTPLDAHLSRHGRGRSLARVVLRNTVVGGGAAGPAAGPQALGLLAGLLAGVFLGVCFAGLFLGVAFFGLGLFFGVALAGVAAFSGVAAAAFAGVGDFVGVAAFSGDFCIAKPGHSEQRSCAMLSPLNCQPNRAQPKRAQAHPQWLPLSSTKSGLPAALTPAQHPPSTHPANAGGPTRARRSSHPAACPLGAHRRRRHLRPPGHTFGVTLAFFEGVSSAAGDSSAARFSGLFFGVGMAMVAGAGQDRHEQSNQPSPCPRPLNLPPPWHSLA